MDNMTFSEKLSFLLNLSGTSNAELARAANIDPSQVSRLKNGTRNTPKRIHTIEMMAEHFATRCVSDYQRTSLAQTLGNHNLLSDRSVPYTADAICGWLRSKVSDSSSRLDNFMRSFEGYNDSAAEQTPVSPSHAAVESHIYSYFGNEGRCCALMDIIDYLNHYGTPCEVYIASDENLNWLVQDRQFSERLIRAMVDLIRKGYTICRIVPTQRDSVEAIESLERWMPVYMSGAMTTYHYPRLRDGLYRRFMVTVPGILTLSSNTLGNSHECGASYISYDQRTIDEDVRYFRNYLDRCVPLARPYIYGHDPVRFSQHLLDFHSIEADTMSKWMGLSCSAVPPFVIDELEKLCSDPISKEVIRLFRSTQRSFERNLDLGYRCVEVIRLFSAEQVLSGDTHLTLSLLLPGHTRSYTVDEYRRHLQYLLSLTEKYSNYYIVIDEGDMPDCELHMKEGQSALLVRTAKPFTLFSITEHNTVSCAKEYITLQATRYGSSLVIQRRHAIEKIRAIITALS